MKFRVVPSLKLAAVAVFAVCTAALAQGGAAAGSAAGGVPPALPAPQARSPVAYFRELLGMSREERRQALGGRAPESQKQILAKVREYEALKPDQRELRLQVTELRWYLMPLLQTPGTNRAAQLALIPPGQRKQVEDRLLQWDALPPDVQKDFLENEAAVRYFTELEVGDPGQRRRLEESLSPARREKLQAGVRQWQALPSEQKDRIVQRFNQFFNLTPEEKDKALAVVSDAERKRLERTLRTFGSLTPAQREACLQSFTKFTSLSLEERQQFLKNAERWKLMTPEQRQGWRDLVAKLNRYPPLPPGMVMPPFPSKSRSSPPMPPNARATPPMATN